MEAAMKVAELPYQMWNEILVRVPAKTVIRFKLVCKSWLKLIDSKIFQMEHWRIIRGVHVSAGTTSSQLITLSPCRPALLSIEEFPVSDDINIIMSFKIRCYSQLGFEKLLRPKLPGQSKTENTILLCFDGLFLVRSLIHLFLCNPITKSRRLHLPFPYSEEMKFVHRWNWAAVYDPSTQGYVILCARVRGISTWVVSSLRIDQINGGGSCRKIGAWRQLWSSEELTLALPGNKISSFLATTSVNGKAHLLFDIWYNFRVADTGILTIDAATEESVFTMCSASPIWPARFFESNQKFYCLKESCSIREALDLWAIEDVNYPTWIKQQHVIINQTRFKPHFWREFNILKHGNTLVFSNSSNMVIYDLNLQKLQVVDILGEEVNKIGMLMPIHYSLLSWN